MPIHSTDIDRENGVDPYTPERMAARAARAKQKARPEWFNWTEASSGASNSSDLFCVVCSEVERLIRSDAFSLIAGNADSTARLIVAQLAHNLKFVPSRETK